LRNRDRADSLHPRLNRLVILEIAWEFVISVTAAYARSCNSAANQETGVGSTTVAAARIAHTKVQSWRTIALDPSSFHLSRHDRRRILHFNVTPHPTSSWIVQQLREAFPYQSSPRFLLFDHDQKYGLEVPAALRALQITGMQTSIQSPWQNGVAERWVGSCRRDLLDHIIALNERHLKRLLADYIRYYHDDRTHLGLRKQTPGGRVRSAAQCRIVAHERLGGLHHRYDQAA
jgi:hypothetical protein